VSKPSVTSSKLPWLNVLPWTNSSTSTNGCTSRTVTVFSRHTTPALASSKLRATLSATGISASQALARLTLAMKPWEAKTIPMFTCNKARSIGLVAITRVNRYSTWMSTGRVLWTPSPTYLVSWKAAVLTSRTRAVGVPWGTKDWWSTVLDLQQPLRLGHLSHCSTSVGNLSHSTSSIAIVSMSHGKTSVRSTAASASQVVTCTVTSWIHRKTTQRAATVSRKYPSPTPCVASMMMSEHRLIPHKPLLVRYVLLRGCFEHYRERHLWPNPRLGLRSLVGTIGIQEIF